MGSEQRAKNPPRCRLEWGRRGAHEGAERGDILVIVDTLSFSSSVVTAIDRGGIIYPCAEEEPDPVAYAERIGAEVSVSRSAVPSEGRYSLSAETYMSLEPGTRIVLSSLNGATCSRYGQVAPYLFVGTLVNVEATAKAMSRVLEETDACVTIVACGERWEGASDDGKLCMAIEDYLGAGAVLSCMQVEKSPEALVCQDASEAARSELPELLWGCESGVELRERGFSQDVTHAARLNLYDSVPVMRGDPFQRFE